MKPRLPSASRQLHRHAAAALALLPGLVLAQSGPADEWTRANVDLRLGFESVKVPGRGQMGLAGMSYLVELRPGLCAGPAGYGAASGQNGGLFTIGAEAALCMQVSGPLSVEAGLYVGGGGGGNAPVGGGLMLRPHLDLLWDFGGWRAGLSYANVRFPSGQIDSNQFGLVLGMNADFTYLPSGRETVPFPGLGRTGVGLDRLVALVGEYRPKAGSPTADGAGAQSRIGYVGALAERYFTPNVYGGFEANAAASGQAAGYAEFLATVGAEFPLAADRFRLGGRLALGAGGGGGVQTGGGLLAKASLDAALRLAPDLSLNLEAGWAWAPQGSFSSPFASLGLRLDLEHSQGLPTRQTLENWVAGVETYQGAARTNGPPQNLQNVVFKFDRFISPALYLSGQVHSAYAGGAGAFAVALFGVGAQWRFAERWLVGGELLAGAAGGGGVATGSGAIAQPMAYLGFDLGRAWSLRVGAGRVKSFDGPLDSTVLDLTLAFAYGVASRP